MQHIYKDKQYLSGSKKRAKTIKSKDVMQEVNTIKSHDEPIPKNQKGKNQKKNPRVIRTMHTHQRMNAFMTLTA